ncbi:hypothetical protein FRC03_003423 [Tulasnella sp. 419]|nr:hypothetical protein FRC03_003423 [Tulasnella sp. 419]
MMKPLSSNLFLGFELATEQLRAAIVDEDLTVLGYEAVDFDNELSEYQTRNGIFTTAGDACTTPVDMWVKALDVLLDKLRDKIDFGKIRAIGGSAQPATVWWTPEAIKILANLTASEPLHTQITPKAFSLLHTPVAQDTSTMFQARALEATLGGPQAVLQRVGTAPSVNVSLPAVQAMKIREGNAETWSKTAKVTFASNFLNTIFLGSFAPLGEAEVSGSGLWNSKKREWDQDVLDVVAGSKEEGGRFRKMLGEVESFGGKDIGKVSSYFVERYGFDKDAFVTPFTSDHLSTYLAACPSPNDAILSFGPQDAVITPATQYAPSILYNVYPHPAQDPREDKRYVVTLTSRNADSSRTLVRDLYTKSWSAFDRLVSVIAPGGSIGLDDKIFSFWLLQPENSASALVRGIYRFETGVKVNEFRDIRANPRCLVESQVLSLRVRYAKMRESGISNSPKINTASKKKKTPTSLLAYRMGWAFDPYDTANLPSKLIVVGSVGNFPSVVSLVADVFNSPVYVPSGAAPSVTSTPATPKADASPGGRLSPILPTDPATSPADARSAAAMGGAYNARWAWRRSVRPEDFNGSFEDEIRGLLKKRWVAAQKAAASITLPVPSLLSPVGGYPQPKRSGLSSSVYVEEETSPVALTVNGVPPGLMGLGLGLGHLNTGGQLSKEDGPVLPTGRARTPTTSSQATNSTVLTQLSIGTNASGMTAMTSPGGAQTPNSGFGAATPASAAPSTLVINMLPTEEKDAQIGLCKVADADRDSFVTYASIVPEFCRLESMVAKAIV